MSNASRSRSSDWPEIPFERDRTHHHYDPEFVTRFWQALVRIDRVFKEFRSRFVGKCSPVHFFWSYAYPAPEGFAEARLSPPAAGFSATLGEFVLPYEAVRTAASPDDSLLDFLQSSYEAAADRAGWPRAALERTLGPPCRPR